MIQGQLHLDALFANVLKSKITKGSASSGNWLERTSRGDN
jgi:hypothetical protein